MTQGSWDKSMETSAQPSRRFHGAARSHGHQVFDGMSHSCCDHRHAQGECRRVSVAAQEMYHSYGNHAHAESQFETQPRVDVSATYQVLDNMPHIHKRVLSVKIHNMAYVVTADMLYQVFSAYGEVEMVLPTTSSMVLIQYQHEQMAAKAHMLLHGRFLYQACCQLEIRYAHEAELDILHSFQCTAQPSLGNNSTTEVNHSVDEGRSAVDTACPQVSEPSPPTSLNQEVSAEQQQHVTLDAIITFLAEWRAKMEQRENSRIEQAELKSELEYFLHHAFDIFEEESESEVVLKRERKKKRKQEEQQRIEQEELGRELDCFLYQAFDLFGEELEGVLEKENEKVLMKHGASTVASLVCGADISTKCEVPQEYLKLYSQPWSDSASIVDFSLDHVIAKQLQNQKLNHIEPRVHWEPGDQEEGNKLMKLTVDSQFLRRKEMLGISILQQSKNYLSCILELSVWLDQTPSCLEQSLQWKLQEISFCNYMSCGGESEKPMLPWNPGELAGGSRSAKVTRKCMPVDILELMQSLLLSHGSSLSQPMVKVKEANRARTKYILPTASTALVHKTMDMEDNWGTYYTQGISLAEAKRTCAIIAVAFLRRGVMLNCYSLQVVVPSWPFPTTSACQFWTAILYGDLAIMFMGASSGLLPAHILVMDANNSITFQKDKSIACFSCKQNQPDIDCANQWDPGILKSTLTYTQIHYLTRMHFSYVRRKFPGILDLCLSASSCKLMDNFQLTCQDTMAAIDCSDRKILEHGSHQGVFIIEVKSEILSVILECLSASLVRQLYWLRCTYLSKTIACISISHPTYMVEMVKNCSVGDLSRSTTKFCGHLLNEIINLLANDHIAEFADLHGGSIQHLHVVLKLVLQLRQCAALGSFGSLLQTYNHSFLWKFVVEMAANWQWDPGTVTPSHAVLKQSSSSPKTEHFWHSTALSSGDSSIPVHNGFSWSKLSVEMKTKWQWYAGSAASSHSILKLNICSRATQTSQMQVMTSRLYCTDKVFIADNSWRNTSLAAVIKQRSLKLRSCSCHHHSYYETNQVSFLQPFQKYYMRHGIDVRLLSFLPP